MAIYLCKEFIEDLKDFEGINFARRVLNSFFDSSGMFRADQNDHRYHNVENAWIRYISRGNSAYRAIYLRRGNDIFLYRAGGHSIEDNLARPSLRGAIEFGDPEVVNNAVRTEHDYQATSTGNPLAPWDNIGFLKNSQPRFLKHSILGRRLIPHRDVWLVSPFLSEKFFSSMSSFGRMLDDLIEDGTKVILVTLPVKQEKLKWISGLENRGIQLYFHNKLHTKLYAFVVDIPRLSHKASAKSNMLLIGSANLTCAGFPLGRDNGNEELCYWLPDTELAAIENYIMYLMIHSYDLIHLRVKYAHGKGNEI